MDDTLLGLYRDHVLGDGHGFGAEAIPTVATGASRPEAVAPESRAQQRKRVRHSHTQAREIAEKIKQFRQLGPCDHD